MVWVAFIVAAVLSAIVVRCQYQIFVKASEGRDYYLGARSLKTDDPVVKQHYRKYVVNCFFQLAPILLGLFLVLIYVG